ncbi:MAG: phosphotransferase, partial [Actinomycetota bacterium]
MYRSSGPEAGRFEALARLLLPAQPQSSGRVLETDRRYTLDRSAVYGADAIVWGRPPLPSGTQGPRLAQNALERERALRSLRNEPPEPLAVVAWHRWHPSSIRPGMLRNGLRKTLLGGLLVEMVTPDGRGDHRVIDEVAGAAGATGRVTDFRPASGGSALFVLDAADGRRVLVRAGLVDTPSDPGHSSGALELLGRDEVPFAPRRLGGGEVAGASWTSESMLSGARPRRITPPLVADLATFCSRLPRSGGPGTAPASDAGVIASALPDHASVVTPLGDEIAAVLQGFPGMMRHGDFWSGNVLGRSGRLSGVIDWDAWHPAAVAGTDLLHFLVVEQALRSQRGLGEFWGRRPWSSEEFGAASALYWRV